MLSAREKQVCELMGGLSDVEIGEALGISEHTVNFHLRRIYSKLGVHSRTDATLLYQVKFKGLKACPANG